MRGGEMNERAADRTGRGAERAADRTGSGAERPDRVLPLPRLAPELDAAADALDDALGRCGALHESFIRHATADPGTHRRDVILGDELRHRRIQVMLQAAGGLAEALREDAAQAHARFPQVDTSGTRLPPEPPSDDPYAVALWWDDLDEPDRELVAHRLGNWCGRTDGLPADVRHRANVAQLAEEIHARASSIADEIAAAEGPDESAKTAPPDAGGTGDVGDARDFGDTRDFGDAGDAGDPGGAKDAGDAAAAAGSDPAGSLGDAATPEADPRDDAEEQARADLRGLLKLRALLSPPGTGLGVPDSVVPAESLAELGDVTTPLDLRGLYLLDAGAFPLKAAFVLGDLSLAHTVILHVPGTTTTVDLRLYREATWMSALRDEAGRILGEERGGTDAVAVVDWIGYQAPYDVASRRALGESGLRWLVPGEAVNDRYAREAAPSLIRFARGLRAVVGPQVRLVASGHSYGASVLGLALRETSVFDACMVAGCPGLFTDDVSKLQIPPGQMYASVATGDVVARLGIFGPDVAKLPGAQLVAPVPHLATYPDGGRSWTKLNMGHESYYERGSSLLHDLASIAVGQQVRQRWPAWAT